MYGTSAIPSFVYILMAVVTFPSFSTMTSVSQSSISLASASAATLTSAVSKSATAATLVTTLEPLATYMPSQDTSGLGLDEGQTFLQSANAGVYIGAIFLGPLCLSP